MIRLRSPAIPAHTSVHVFLSPSRETHHNAAPEIPIPPFLIINDVDEASHIPELHMKVREMSGYASAQALFTGVYDTLCMMLTPLAFSFTDLLAKSQRSFVKRLVTHWNAFHASVRLRSLHSQRCLEKDAMLSLHSHISTLNQAVGTQRNPALHRIQPLNIFRDTLTELHRL
jgi:hypothetical protein